jgi:hypothetical protein
MYLDIFLVYRFARIYTLKDIYFSRKKGFHSPSLVPTYSIRG